MTHNFVYTRTFYDTTSMYRNSKNVKKNSPVPITFTGSSNQPTNPVIPV